MRRPMKGSRSSGSPDRAGECRTSPRLPHRRRILNHENVTGLFRGAPAMTHRDPYRCQRSVVRARLRRCLAGLLLSGCYPAGASGQDMSTSTERRVTRSTVMVLMDIPGKQQGASGSGCFINGNGMVITNNHVVDPNHGKSVEERLRSASKITLPKYHVVVDSGTRRQRLSIKGNRPMSRCSRSWTKTVCRSPAQSTSRLVRIGR